MLLKVVLLALVFCAGIGSQTMTGTDSSKAERTKNLSCLAKNIFYESGSESIQGKIAVAHVTHNRMKSSVFPVNYCEVVYQRKQFSWTSNDYYQSLHPISDQDWRWKESLYVAENFNLYKDPTNGSTFFHEKSIEPGWRMNIEKTKIVGNHVFYRLISDN
jgi:spore germination cell wall hydrolase CwlJ-like protein